MAFSSSGLFFLTFEKMLINTAALSLEDETHKTAMFTNSITTPNFDTNTAYGSAPFNANEVTGTAYSGGGTTLTTTEVTVSSGTLMYDADDAAWAASTIANAHGALIYAAANSNEAFVGVTFGADYSTTNGTFTIQWNVAGIFTITGF